MIRKRHQALRFSRASGRRLGAKWLGVSLALSFAALAACVSQGERSTEIERLRAVLAKMPPQPPEAVKGAPDESTFGDYHIHLTGLVECGGFVRKQQTVFAQAWATRGDGEGERAELTELELRIEYLGGLFQGLTRKKVVYSKSGVRTSDVVHGNFLSDPCGCARFVATGKVPAKAGRLRTRLKVCPGGGEVSEPAPTS